MDEGTFLAAVEAAGTPSWIVDLDRVTQNARELSRIAGEGAISYAIKANDHPAVLRAAKRGDVKAEAASGREYGLARGAGFSGAEIVLNGPLKTDDDLDLAFAEGALVNADSLDELRRMIARPSSAKRIGVRVQSNLIEGAVGDRFGLTNEETVEAARMLVEEGIELEQLHTHLGSYAVQDIDGPTAKKVDLIWPRDPQLTGALAARMVELAQDLADAGLEPQTINLGGGLPSLPAAADHIAAANGTLKASGLSAQLCFEPGRAIVSDAASLVCQVVQVRAGDRDGRQQVVVDAGVNLLPSVQWRDAQLSALDGRPGDQNTVVFGPLCLQSDVLAWNATLPEVRVGDLLVAESVGAYNWVRSTSFIFPTAPIVLLQGGETTIDSGQR